MEINRISAYMSHNIRGQKGANATLEEMTFNNNKAIIIAKELRRLYPFLDIYVPAENGEFDIECFFRGYLTAEQILTVDCEILRKRDFLLVYNWEGISEGMDIEIKYAKKLGKKVIEFKYLGEAISKLNNFLGVNL